MTLLECINRIFRSNGIIRGDDDPITTFSDTAHNAAIQLAVIAAQDELQDLISDREIPYEVTSGTISTTASTRTYALASDFIRFYGHPKLYLSSENRYLFEYPGGRDALALAISTYKTDTGSPNWWYFEPTTTKQIGFYHVPNAIKSYAYDYEKNVAVSVASDTLPFHTDSEGQAFAQAAGRRFKALFEERQDAVSFILKDPTYITARSRFASAMHGKNGPTRYGSRIR